MLNTKKVKIILTKSYGGGFPKSLSRKDLRIIDAIETNNQDDLDAYLAEFTDCKLRICNLRTDTFHSGDVISISDHDGLEFISVLGNIIHDKLIIV